MEKQVTYKSAGVDIDAGLESLERIKLKAKSTHGPQVLTGLGSFGSLFDLSSVVKEYKEPVLVQSVDGVGTKLMVAVMAGKFDTVGMDIVNHSCNDILCQGAKPLTFLDYIAVESLRPDQIEDLVGGMAIACKENGVALVGGETAELPGVYVKGEFDLAGTITGVVEKSKTLTGEEISVGDVVLGIESDGLHTNGYTLARKVFFDIFGHSVDTYVEELGATVGEALLVPHRDYSKTIWPLLQKYRVKGLAHITGGGLIDNPPRILPKNVDALINKSAWRVPPLFAMIQKGGSVPDEDMFRSLNMGIGMIVVIGNEGSDLFAEALREKGEKVYTLGEIVEGRGKTRLI